MHASEKEKMEAKRRTRWAGDISLLLRFDASKHNLEISCESPDTARRLSPPILRRDEEHLTWLGRLVAQESVRSTRRPNVGIHEHISVRVGSGLSTWKLEALVPALFSDEELKSPDRAPVHLLCSSEPQVSRRQRRKGTDVEGKKNTQDQT